MKRPQRRLIERYIHEGRRYWAIDPQWKIDFAWVDGVKVEGSPTDIAIEFNWTEKRAHIQIDRNNPPARKELRRDITHELGHLVLAPIWRAMSDFTDNYIPDKKARGAYEEAVNSAENITIDHVVAQVFGL